MGQGGVGLPKPSVCSYSKPQKSESSLRVLLPVQLTEREGRGAVHNLAKQIWRKQCSPGVKFDTQDTLCVHTLGESSLVFYFIPMLD